MTPRPAQGILRALGIVLFYGAVLAVLGLGLPLFEAAPGVVLWTPLAGLHVAVLVLFGLAYLPVVLAAAFVGELVLGTPLDAWPALVLASVIAALGYGAAAVWLQRAVRRGPFRAVRLVVHVAAVALVVPLGVELVAGLGATLLGQPGLTPLAWQGWAAAAIGILTLTPLLLADLGPHVDPALKETMAGERMLPVRAEESMMVLALELGSIGLALYGVAVGGPPLLFIVLVPVLWVAARHGLARAALAVALVNIGLGAVLQGSAEPAWAAPLCMMVLAGAGLALGAATSERKRTAQALNQAYAVVAERLEVRTLAWNKARHNMETQIQERRQAEETLHASVSDLQASRDELQDAIAQQARLNEKLRASEQQFKDLNGRKDKFFSIVSHDVKGMLVSAIGFSKLLISDADTLPRDMIKEFASHVHSSTTNTYDLLENLLTWTRMQTGRMLYHRSWHGVDDIIQNNLTMLQDNAARKGIRLSRQGDREAQVYADRNMINSVLQNLISNAIKFTEHGGEVTVHSRTYDHTVEIAVRDNGVGISPENLSKLFRIDVNHSTLGTDEEDGTGLGLVLCKEMVEKHEGRIWAESEPGKGSAFYFTLPCAAEATDAP